jgi:hypothetical protein
MRDIRGDLQNAGEKAPVSFAQLNQLRKGLRCWQPDISLGARARRLTDLSESQHN